MKKIIGIVMVLAVLCTFVPGTTAYADSVQAPDADQIVIVLDAGHGGSEKGAYRTWNKKKYYEKNMNLAIAKACKTELETYAGVKVYMTRSSDRTVTLGARIRYAKSKKADLFVSLHNNASTKTADQGACVYYPNSSYRPLLGEMGEEAADCIQEQLADLGIQDNGTLSRDSSAGNKYPDKSKADYYYVIRHSKYAGFPGLIVEHAYVSNESDCKNYLGTAAKLKALGIADATGIAEYFDLVRDQAPEVEEPQTDENGAVLLKWEDLEDAEYYRIYRREKGKKNYTCIADDVTEASYTDTTAASGKTYEYAVCGCRIGETKDVFMQMSDTMTITVP